MRFFATNHNTNEQREVTEAEVRAEIIDTFQHDMGKQETDEEIAEGVNASDVMDFFAEVTIESNVTCKFEGRNFDITRLKLEQQEAKIKCWVVYSDDFPGGNIFQSRADALEDSAEERYCGNKAYTRMKYFTKVELEAIPEID